MKRQFELGIRLLALYYFLSEIENIVLTIHSIIYGYYESNELFVTSCILLICSYILILAMIIKPQLISNLLRLEDSSDVVDKDINYVLLLRIGLILVGVSYFLYELFYFLKYTYMSFSIQYGQMSELLSHTFRRIIVLLFSMILIYRSDSIAKFLLKEKTNPE